MHGGRFAVGAGHRDELQLSGRVLEHLRSEIGERRAAIGHDRDWDLRPQLPLRDDGDRAALDGFRGELVPIAVESFDRDEQRSGRDLARVVGDGAHVEIFSARGHRHVRALQERPELHR